MVRPPMASSLLWWLLLPLLCLDLAPGGLIGVEGRILLRSGDGVKADLCGQVLDCGDRSLCLWRGVECSDRGRVIALIMKFPNNRRLLQVVNKARGRYHTHGEHHVTAPASSPSPTPIPPIPPFSLNKPVLPPSPASTRQSTASSPSLDSDLMPPEPSPSPLKEAPSPSTEFVNSGNFRQPSAPVPNPLMQEGPPHAGVIPSSNHTYWAMYTSIAGGVSFLIAISAIYIFCCRANKVVTVMPWSTGLSGQLQKALVTGVPSLKRSELERACEDFSNVIGSLSDCMLYKGTLSSGVEIAVTSTTIMLAKDWTAQAEAQFRKKISVLSKVNHKNFMNLLGYCEEEEPFTRMMVFEYSPNGTLFEHLHIREAEHLDWATRLRIAMGTAYCLEHMHQLAPPVVLRNLHSSSIYLTDDYAAKISDLGFWNDETESEASEEGTGLAETQLPAAESVVYKFGIILLEMISGRRPFSEDDGLLVLWASCYLTGQRPLTDMVDPTLESFREEDISALCEVIRPCINPDPRERPTMTEVAGWLRNITTMPPDVATPKLSPLWWAELEVISL